MTAPLIGITIYSPNSEGRFHLPTEYVQAVRRAGGIPLLMPPGEPRLDEWVAHLDAVVLTGGGDVAPNTYDGPDHPLVYDVSPERDADEMLVARHLVETDLPGLCICRGMQILNVMLGGSLITHLPDTVGHEIAHRRDDRGPLTHPVHLDADSRLGALIGAKEIHPHSWHHQALDRVSEGLRVVARAPDGVVEAVEMQERSSLFAVQWHPELLAATDPTQQRLFDTLADKARERRSRSPSK